MKEKLFALLVAKFAGVRKDGLTQLARALSLQAANDEEAEVLVSKLTKDQVDTFIKEFRADVDKEVTEGNKTFEANLKKKYELVEKKGEDPAPDDSKSKGGSSDDIQSLIKNAISEAVKPFQEKLSALEMSAVAKSRQQQLEEKLSNCKDDVFKTKVLKDFSRMKFDSDEEFIEYLSETESDVTTVNQNLANAGLVEQGQPIFGTPGKSEEDTFVQAMKAINETKE